MGSSYLDLLVQERLKGFTKGSIWTLFVLDEQVSIAFIK